MAEQSEGRMGGSKVESDQIKYAQIVKGVCTGCGATDGNEGCDGDHDFCWINNPEEREKLGLSPKENADG